MIFIKSFKNSILLSMPLFIILFGLGARELPTFLSENAYQLRMILFSVPFP
jgi:hypothetical protein